MEPNVFKTIGDLTTESCLDAGCGNEGWALLLKKKTNGTVIGFDSSTNLIDIAKESFFE